MTRLMITFTAVTLSISFAPAAQAYEVEPATYVAENELEMVVPDSQRQTLDAACSLPIASLLVTMLALPDDVRADTNARKETTLACSEQ